MTSRLFSLRVLSGAIAMSVLSGCGDGGEPQSSPDWAKFVTAELVEFSVADAPCTFSDKSLELMVTLTNRTESEIVEVAALATVNDLMGAQITVLNLVGGEPFGPNQQSQLGSWGELCYDMDHSSPRAKMLLEMENIQENTAVIVEVSKITFDNGEILEF